MQVRRGVGAIALALAVTMAVPGTASAAPSPGGPGLGEPFEFYKWQGNGGYDVLDYDLDLTYEPSTDQLTGKATITAKATKDLSEFNLDFWLKSSSITVNGAPATFHHMTEDPSELVVKPGKPISGGTPFRVVVAYSGVPSSVSESGVVRWNRTGPANARTGGLSVNQPRTAEWWYPVNDHPSDKATFGVSVDVPDGHVAVSNGKFLGRTSDHFGRTTWNWASGQPMAPYLAFIAIEKFHVEEGTSSVNGGIPYFRAYDPNLTALGLMPTAKKVIEATDQVTSFLAGKFGPYPFDVTGGVATSGITFAIENQTRSVYGTGVLARGKFDRDETWVTAHEQAHQWFGDSVSLANWKQMWLNEGFATYAEWLWSEQRGEATADKLADAYYNLDWANDPDFKDPTFWNEKVADPTGIFRSAVYYRGAMALHALRKHVGDTKFFQILRTYHSRYQYKNAYITDFTAVAKEIGGPGVDQVFTTWIYTAGKPPKSPTGLATEDIRIDATTARQVTEMAKVHQALKATGHGAHGHAPPAETPTAAPNHSHHAHEQPTHSGHNHDQHGHDDTAHDHRKHTGHHHDHTHSTK